MRMKLIMCLIQHDEVHSRTFSVHQLEVGGQLHVQACILTLKELAAVPS
jgi:hypothetical protein